MTHPVQKYTLIVTNNKSLLGITEFLCPNDCTGAGECLKGSGKCLCQLGRIGEDCSSKNSSKNLKIFKILWSNLKFSEFQCPGGLSPCSERGLCNENTGKCTCNDQYEGEACESKCIVNYRVHLLLLNNTYSIAFYVVEAYSCA